MIRVDYYEVSLDQVMNYFAKDFKIRDGVKPADIPPEWVVDAVANRVIFKLFVEMDDPPVAAPPTVQPSASQKRPRAGQTPRLKSARIAPPKPPKVAP